MTTMMSPRNMLLAGIVLVLLNVAALAPMATGAVEGAVEDNFASFSKDSVCANDDCTEAEEDWASSTASRDFYGYSITNVADVMASGAAPVYEKVGPVTYDITTTRTILDYDSAAGELTYNSVKSFACSADTEVPCDTPVSQLNIAFQTQVIGATGMAVEGIMDVTKAAFTAGMLAQDLESLGAGQMTADMMSSHIAGASAVMQGMSMPEAMADDLAGAAVADGFWDNAVASVDEQTGGMMTLQEMYGLGEDQEADFTNTSANHAFYDAEMDPTGEDISLTGMLGVLVLAGHCDSFPTENMSAMMAAAGADTLEMTGVMQRASLWG